MHLISHYHNFAYQERSMHWYKLKVSSIENYSFCITRIGSSPAMFLTKDHTITMNLVRITAMLQVSCCLYLKVTKR